MMTSDSFLLYKNRKIYIRQSECDAFPGKPKNVMAEAIGMAAARPLYDRPTRMAAFNAVLLGVIGLTPAQSIKMTQNGVAVVDDITRLDENTILEIFPTTGATALSAMQKMKLKSLRQWAINKIKELGEGQVLTAAEFTNDVSRKTQLKLASVAGSNQHPLIVVAPPAVAQVAAATALPPCKFWNYCD